MSHTGVPPTRAVAFRFALDPTAEQTTRLFAHAGAARFTFNHHLARVRANLEQRHAEASYGIPRAARLDALRPAATSGRRGWMPGSRRRVRDIHARVARLRAMQHHALTKQLTAGPARPTVEDLDVAGMLVDPKLARALSDAAPGTLRRQHRKNHRGPGSEPAFGRTATRHQPSRAGQGKPV